MLSCKPSASTPQDYQGQVEPYQGQYQHARAYQGNDRGVDGAGVTSQGRQLDVGNVRLLDVEGVDGVRASQRTPLTTTTHDADTEGVVVGVLCCQFVDILSMGAPPSTDEQARARVAWMFDLNTSASPDSILSKYTFPPCHNMTSTQQAVCPAPRTSASMSMLGSEGVEVEVVQGV
mmetsp:Transcript_10195/g.22615  ORF Transcript_10195/g.22615 Transcript_10195/m.22615 type:complete len:176 (-) Transcript_10195:792-1319(-)